MVIHSSDHPINVATLLQAYNLAMRRGLYNSVEVHGPQGLGPDGCTRVPVKAYACTNCMEFFAELSVAYHWHWHWHHRDTGKRLGRDKDDGKGEGEVEVEGSTGADDNEMEYNKWFPFNRRQLLQHDPDTVAVLQKFWLQYETIVDPSV